MKKNFYIAAIIVVASFGIIGAGIYKNISKEGKVKIVDYKSPKYYDELSYQIDKYENIEGVAWKNENKIITYIPNEEKNMSTLYPGFDEYHIGIYNLKDKTIKEYKDAKVDALNIGISQDGKFVIYRKFDENTKNGYENILNLENGSITHLKEYSKVYEKKCVADNKLLILFGDEWKIINMEDKSVICEGKLQDSNITIIGSDDIIEKDGDLQGKFYYKAEEGEKIKICTVNIKTRETKMIYEDECQDIYGVYKKADTIVLEKNIIEDDAGKMVRPFSYVILDAEGNKIKEIEIEDEPFILEGLQGGSQLSSDGSKLVYIAEEDGKQNHNNILKVLDIKSGKIKTVADKSIFNISENNDNRMVEFLNIKWNKNKVMFLAEDLTRVPSDELDGLLDSLKDGEEDCYEYKINKLGTCVVTFEE